MKNSSFMLLITVILFVVVFTTACGKKEEKEEVPKKETDYLVLVNKYSKLPDEWEPNVELVNTKNAWNEDIQVEKKAYENYKKLKKALEKEGITIELDSVYRSVKEQQELWDNWTKEKGIDYVKKYVAVPGYSEHHTGLAIDICIKKDGQLIAENEDMIAEREIFSKIHKKLADYGFILRYLEGKDDITGYAYEPWHLRYVGNTEIAKEIMDNNLTFEEYLGSVTSLENNTSAAKYQIEVALQNLFKEVYGDQISNARFNVKKVYSTKEVEESAILQKSKIGKNDVAFEVEYELMPSEGVDPNTLTIPNGKYDAESGWVKDISRVGILRLNDSGEPKYKISNFGTGF